MAEAKDTGRTKAAPGITIRGRQMKLLSWVELMHRATRYAVLGVGFLIVALGIGIVGYRWIADLSWIDALFNASMILSGMGPVDPMPDSEAKLFASAYALVGGAVYPAVMGIVIYPFVHHMLLALHIQAENAGND